MLKGGPVCDKFRFLIVDEILFMSWIYTMCVRKGNRVQNCFIPLLRKQTARLGFSFWINLQNTECSLI